jgi:peptidoglycan/LPS O-acetylase OafA/YrhL
MKNRLQEIDDIRGISMIVMILIHTNAYLLHYPWASITREISQFAVVAFLFCSSYISVTRPYPQSFAEFAPYIYKRLKRLLAPYYVFLMAYIVFMSLVAHKPLSQSAIVQSFLLTGGIDFNWLVLLFTQLIFITPLLQYLFDKKRLLFYMYTAAALVSSIYFLTHTPLTYYRWIMWLPWSLVIIYTKYFDALWNDKKKFIIVTLFFGIIYFATAQFVLMPAHHSLSMYSNKYPPNLYHIAYSLFALNILYLLSKYKLFASSLVQSVISYFSLNSYTIYFIHILVIEGAVRILNMKRIHWVLFFAIVAYVSVLIQLAYDALLRKMEAKK